MWPPDTHVLNPTVGPRPRTYVARMAKAPSGSSELVAWRRSHNWHVRFP